MARRPAPVKAFVPATKTLAQEVEDSQATARKAVWTPPPSIQSLVTKVEQVEERLDHLEVVIWQETDLTAKRRKQEEVDQSRQELDDMRRQLEDTLQRLQQREADLQDTRDALDNLTNQTAMDRKKIDLLEAEKKELHQMVKDMETKLNERARKVGRLEKQVQIMQDSLHHTNNNVAALQHDVQQMQERMNSIVPGSNSVPAPGTGQAFHQRPGSVTRSQGFVGSPPVDKREPKESSRHHTGTLGLPPIPLPSRNGRMSSRGNVKYNFPPGKI